MTTETKQNDSKLVPETQRQYTLLREFNLEQAQAGYEILSVLSSSYSYVEVIQEVKFKGVTSNLQEVFVEDKQGEGYVRGTQRVKMKPLCWLEGKPVYKGDKLWYKSNIDKKYHQHEANNLVDDCLFDDGNGFVLISSLTWDKPKEPHVHQDLIDAYNKGARIQYWSCLTEYGYQWKDVQNPCWSITDKYRIKPEPKKMKSGWINLWKNSNMPSGIDTGIVHSTKEYAEVAADHQVGFLHTIEIHWEE